LPDDVANKISRASLCSRFQDANQMIISGNQQFLKSTHRMEIVRKVRANPGISRAELADEVSLTKATVGKLVEELIEEGWLTESAAAVTGKLGRRPTPLAVNTARHTMLGASISGSHSKLMAVSLGGEVLKLVSRSAPDTPREVVDALADQVEEMYCELTAEGREVSGLGVAVPGPIRPESGVLQHSESTGWREVPVFDMLRRALNRRGLPPLPLRIERAVACIALQHCEFQRASEDDLMLYLHIGRNVALAAVSNHQVMRGRRGLAGWCAHLQLEPDGPICDCGQRGCTTAVLSQRAMELALGMGPPAIAQQAAAGNHQVLQVLRATGTKLGTFLFNLCMQYDPLRVFVGGPAFETGDDYLHAAQTQLDLLGRGAGIALPQIQRMQTNQHNVALGAAIVVLHALLSAPATPAMAVRS
jgi:predicted NBD/HSP70 family sugar kinase